MNRAPNPTLEQEIAALLERRPELKDLHGIHAGEVLLRTAQQLDRCFDTGSPEAALFLEANPIRQLDTLPADIEVACPGVRGAFTHMAVERLFQNPQTLFFEEFHEVLAAVQDGRVRFGVLPVENSSAGAVTQTLDLVAQHKLYICRSISLKVEHCFCAHPDTDPATIHTVISHPQALTQCTQFWRARGLTTRPYSNTATAAKKVAEAPGDYGCICSRYSAGLYGLRILDAGVQDFDENYTRFICVSAEGALLPGASCISLTLSFPNEPGALGRLLTRFSACRLNLIKLVSMPIASRDFNVRFHLDFTGSVRDQQVTALLGAMTREYNTFHYLGNYEDLGVVT